jgi:hypothetical protein
MPNKYFIPKSLFNDQIYIFQLLNTAALSISCRIKGSPDWIDLLVYLLCAIETMTGHMHEPGFNTYEYNPLDYKSYPDPSGNGHPAMGEFPLPLEDFWLLFIRRINGRLQHGKWYTSPLPPYHQFIEVLTDIENDNFRANN